MAKTKTSKQGAEIASKEGAQMTKTLHFDEATSTIVTDPLTIQNEIRSKKHHDIAQIMKTVQFEEATSTDVTDPLAIQNEIRSKKYHDGSKRKPAIALEGEGGKVVKSSGINRKNANDEATVANNVVKNKKKLSMKSKPVESGGEGDESH